MAEDLCIPLLVAEILKSGRRGYLFTTDLMLDIDGNSSTLNDWTFVDRELQGF